MDPRLIGAMNRFLQFQERQAQALEQIAQNVETIVEAVKADMEYCEECHHTMGEHAEECSHA